MTSGARCATSSQSRPVLHRVHAFLDSDLIRSALPKSGLARGTNYIRNHWDLLNTYLLDGRLSIDNNDTEQLMKYIAIGRKNWLSVHSVAAGERAASCMTLVSSAQRNALHVTMYLKDVLDHF